MLTGLITSLTDMSQAPQSPTRFDREFTKPRRQQQRERHRTKDLKARTMAVHVRFNSWYISLTSSAKQQREMTKSSVVWRT